MFIANKASVKKKKIKLQKRTEKIRNMGRFDRFRDPQDKMVFFI